jgi:hypothetical protein
MIRRMDQLMRTGGEILDANGDDFPTAGVDLEDALGFAFDAVVGDDFNAPGLGDLEQRQGFDKLTLFAAAYIQLSVTSSDAPFSLQTSDTVGEDSKRNTTS